MDQKGCPERSSRPTAQSPLLSPDGPNDCRAGSRPGGALPGLRRPSGALVLQATCGGAWTGRSRWRIYDLRAAAWNRRGRMVHEIEHLRDEVRCRMGIDLAELANDHSVTRDGWIRCIRAASDFEDAVHAILNEAWIPNTLPQLTASLIHITDNIRKTHERSTDRPVRNTRSCSRRRY